MPRIDDDVLDTSIYLYSSRADASTGSRTGGSGFLVGVDANDAEPITSRSLLDDAMTIRLPWKVKVKDTDGLTGASFFYAVSSAHVARKSPIIRLNTRDGEKGTIELTASDWISIEPADIAVAPVTLSKRDWKALSIPITMCLTEQESRKLEVGIGDDVFMVGRFISNEGRQQNRPAVRFGNISMMPVHDEPIGLDKDTGIKPQVAYLIETRTVPGFSGSPVFLSIPQWELAAAPWGYR